MGKKGLCRRLCCCHARAAVLAVIFGGLCSAQTPGAYHIDPKASRIAIHVFRAGLLGGLGDNHRIVLQRFSGTAQASPGKTWRVQVRADAASLEVTDPDSSVSTRQEVQRIMLGRTQLDVATYPTIELESRSLVAGPAEKTWRMLADLTVHGVTCRVELPLAWSESGDRLRVQGKRELRLRDFNIQPIRKFLGTIQVRNEFELECDITLQR